MRRIGEIIILFLIMFLLLLFSSIFYSFATGMPLSIAFQKAVENMFNPQEGPILSLFFSFLALFVLSSLIIYLKDILIAPFILVSMKIKVRMKNHVIICGAGRVGRAVAYYLKQKGIKSILVEVDEEKVRDLKAKGYNIIKGDALDEHTLERVNIKKARAVVACLGKDDDNLFLVITAKGMNPKVKVLARASDERALKKMKLAGADYVIMPELAGGKELAENV